MCAFPLPVCSSAVALDIDGTIDVAQSDVLGLVQSARALGAHVAINTARPQLYCDSPDPLTLRLAAREHHYCGHAHILFNALFADVPAKKVENMGSIAGRVGVQRRSCVVLVDDRPENIEAVERAGYTGILVNERTGITRAVAHGILDRVRACKEASEEPA